MYYSNTMTEDESTELLSDSDSDDDSEKVEEVLPVPEKVPEVAPVPPGAAEEIKDGLKATPVVWISAILCLFFLLGIYDFATSR